MTSKAKTKSAILMLLRNHFTNDSRVLKEARSLAHNGYDVTIKCLWDEGLPKEEIIHGFAVERITKVPRKKLSLFLKLWFVFLFTIQCLFGNKKYDVVHAHDLDVLPAAVLVKWLSFNKKKVVYDSHEYQTQKAHTKNIIKPIIAISEKLFIRFADKAIVVGESIGDEYKKLYNIEKPTVIFNCPPYKPSEQHNIFREKFGIADDTIIFLYQGGLIPHRGIENIYEAFQRHKEPNKVCILMGYGSLEGKIKAIASANENIFFHEAVTPDVLLDYTSSADVGIILYENTCLNHYYCLPNKIFEYTMAGLPVIASDLYEINNFITMHKNGVVLKENTVACFIDAIESVTSDLVAHMKTNISDVQKAYNWEKQEEKLLELYRDMGVSK